MGYKKFITKFCVFLTPFLFIIVIYIVKDPFKIIYSYSSYYKDGSIQGVILNRDYVSFETYKTNSLKYDFDSFIFGNSRSIFYQKNFWQKYLSPNSEIFHFDASGESLFGIESKIRYLDNEGISLNNALLVIDQSVLSKTDDSKGFLLMKHYSLSEKNRLSFHLEFFKAFLNFKFISCYLYFQITGKIETFMKNLSILEDRPMNYDFKCNEISFNEIDSIIENFPDKFYTKDKKNVFYNRDSKPIYGDITLNSSSIKMLVNISKIFKKHNTKFRVIINPLYDQVKINPRDLSLLNQIFDDNNVFDFSGKNQFTNDFNNYYETSHYRPLVAEQILSRIY